MGEFRSPQVQGMGQGIVIHGAQWGDEGKGKIVDLLTETAKAVVVAKGMNDIQAWFWTSRSWRGGQTSPVGFFCPFFIWSPGPSRRRAWTSWAGD